MVETRQVTDIGDPYMYQEEGYDPYLQDADILDRPDLFYDGRSLGIVNIIHVVLFHFFFYSKTNCPIFELIFNFGGKSYDLEYYKDVLRNELSEFIWTYLIVKILMKKILMSQKNYQSLFYHLSFCIGNEFFY